MRTLLYVPLAHHPYEVGEGLAREALGTRYDSYIEELKSFWGGVAAQIARRKIDKIYQDGCISSDFIVKELYRKYAEHTGNMRLVCDLMDRGAELIKTESWWLCLFTSYGSSQLGTNLLGPRDRYIVRRINNTLQEGETGIIFMGGAHSVDKLIETQVPSINVERLDTGYERIERILDAA
jgi:hypothetical protein